MYASVPMLAYGIKSYNMDIIKVIIFTIITLYAGFFAALIWNDITDADIDSVAHPDRPIPSGRISKKRFFAIALFFSALVFIFAIFVSPICLIIVGAAALFVTFHDKYLKKRVKIPAYSEIFTPVQWVVVAVFGFFAIWTAIPQSSSVSIDLSFLGAINTNKDAIIQMIILVLFTYFADNAHDLAEGIVDAEGDKKHGVRTYATSFGEKNAARVSFIWFLISGILGVILFYMTILSFVFLIFFIILWLYIMFYYYKLLKSDKDDIKKIGAIVGRKGFDYFLFSYNLIFLDVLIQIIIFNFY
jgi:4-hydroxybenzoate polyprenyltransferase